MKKFSIFERDGLIWSGNSIFEQSGPYFPRSINLEMMGQDAGATIFGQCRLKHERGGRRFSSVNFRLEPEDKTVIDSFRTLVGGQFDDIDYSIAEFLNMTARTIVVEGRFVYELQIGRDKDTQKIVEMNFSPVFAPSSKVFIFGKQVIQLFPSSIAEEYSCSRIRILKPADTFIFKAPSYWRHALGKARSGLHFYDAMNHCLIDQLTKSTKSDKGRVCNYDASSNLKMLAKETAPLGWSGRNLFQGHQNDYLSLERLIRWNTFCIDLRNYIICSLEAAIRRIGSILKSDCRLIVEEESEYSLEDVRKKLQEGKTSTVELVRSLY